MTKLTVEQIENVKNEMIPDGIPVRFIDDFCTVNVETGERYNDRGVNVIHKLHYWNFTKETAIKIAEWLGVKASFDGGKVFDGRK